ncbi:hypothetical protein M408DRAFT_11680 [Serendipita vermifera MAFF 305830]|uniref:Uncharacterized protein n=1 Tax=Serendipita vermifera MAFF 305830 TaxID=933852 RepID=A0A0C2W9V7_SERVB|nr:hypothetical protein M408DRAFT_11680 [Serendipita vermifera MAFF 305830]
MFTTSNAALPETVDEAVEKKNTAHFRNIRHWIASGKQETQTLFIDDYDPSANSSIYATLKSTKPSWKAIFISLNTDKPRESWDIEKIRAKKVFVCLSWKRAAMSQLVPLLRQATDLTTMGMPPPWGNTPWVSLLQLEITRFADDTTSDYVKFGATTLRKIFDAAVNLETLVLDFCVAYKTPSNSETQDRDRVRHGALKSLSFALHHLEENGCLFGIQIDPPLLRHATVLSSDRSRLSENPSEIETWQGVTSVTVDLLADGEVTALVQFLRCLPKVASIELQGKCTDALFILVNGFYSHIPPSYSTILFPKLTKVTMANTDIEGKTLIKMLETRLAQLESGLDWVSAVTDVTLYDADKVTPMDWERVNTLLESDRVTSIPDTAMMPSG